MKIFQSFAGFMEKTLPFLFRKLPNPGNGEAVDLNNYVYDGYVFQSTNANAQLGTNYPEPLAGRLTVTCNGDNPLAAGAQIYQEYAIYDNRRTYKRTRFNGVWTAWVLQLTTNEGTAQNSLKLDGRDITKIAKLGENNTGTLTTDGVFNSSNQATWSLMNNADWTQGAFHKQSQPYALDGKTTWLVSTNTQYSNGYSMMSKFGMRRDGFDYHGGFELQHVGEGNARLGRWMFNRGGDFVTGAMTLLKDIDGNNSSDNHSRIIFRRKQAQDQRKVLGGMFWDSYRDVSDPSYVAGIWAEGAGTAGNWGELKFGVKTNGDPNYPNVKMSVTESGVQVTRLDATEDIFTNKNATSSQVHTYYLKSRDVAGAIADLARDWNGVSTLLRWQNYGNGHVIFDASKGVSPTGSPLKDSARSDQPWQRSYPTLMGWNGQDTFGVRVDNARTADLMTDGSFGVPVGMIMAWPTTAIPAGWLSMDGRSTNGFPVLASIYGANLPNYNNTTTEGGLFLSSARQGRGADPHNAVGGKVGAHEHAIGFNDGGFLRYSGGGGLPGVNYVTPNSRGRTVENPSGNNYPTHIVVNWVVRAG